MFKQEQNSHKFHLVLFWHWFEAVNHETRSFQRIEGILSGCAIFKVITPTVIIKDCSVIKSLSTILCSKDIKRVDSIRPQINDRSEQACSSASEKSSELSVSEH